MSRFSVGSLVRCREREWVVLPSPDEDLLLLRPLGGATAEICGVFLPVEGDQISETSFAPPTLADLGDFQAGALLRNAARLSLRSGAGPFRSLGQLTVRPRPYQLVPLLMALRLDPIRLLIADDVGIGKTIEAGLIVRELIDRGLIARLTVLCPPHLCEQWQRELNQKFALEAVVVRSSTAARLERSLPRSDLSVWEHFPITVASIDYVKSERRRDTFLRAAPELVIVDEAHAAVGSGASTAQQQRYELVRELAARPERHLLLLTATPHSGLSDAFSSLLGLLDPRFVQFDLNQLHEAERESLARHFVQRRRSDVQRWLGSDDVTPFPVRESAEVTYLLPRAALYRKLFDEVYHFTRELVQSSGLANPNRVWQQRARYWAALALLRCVMSSPAAAEKALRLRAAGLDDEDLLSLGSEHEDLLRGYVYDATDQEVSQDQEPASLVAQGSSQSERARLNRFAARAAELRGSHDPKLQRLIQVLSELVRDGFNPIVYCRYLATADYLAAELNQHFAQQAELRIIAITGERSEEEREAMIDDLATSPRRLLVATDCLSEGINLQGSFDAVVHYDLPWNPNRLEQREGRVDRYGQPRPVVRTVLLYGQDNPMDEAVMKVLLRKAVHIHRTLGISVPLPIDSGTVVETLIASLFQPAVEQLELFDATAQASVLEQVPAVQALETAWNRAVEREQLSRTRFAQRRIKPEEVARELAESDAVLGEASAVEWFVRTACERLGVSLLPDPGSRTSPPQPGCFVLALNQLPEPIREQLAALSDQRGELLVSFADPAPAGVIGLHRNHRLVMALVDYLMESALTPEAATPVVARAGVIRSRAVPKRTRLLLLRVRMLIENRSRTTGSSQTPLLAEELIVTGYRGPATNPDWLDQHAALTLLEQAQPAANLSPDERTLAFKAVENELPTLAAALDQLANQRAEQLREAHLRVRAQIGGGAVRVQPAGPPDLLGLYVLLPAVG